MNRLNLVWVNQLENFLKESIVTGDLVILGDSISLELLNLLISKYDVSGITFVYVKDSAKTTKSRFEQFYLGRAAAEKQEFCVYGGASEEVLDMAGMTGVTIVNDLTFQTTSKPRKKKEKTPLHDLSLEEVIDPKDQELIPDIIPDMEKPVLEEKKEVIVPSIEVPKRRRRTKTEIALAESTKEVKEGLQNEREKILEKPEKKKTAVTPVTEGHSSKEKADFIKGILDRSDLSAEDKKWFSTPGRLSMIEDVVKKSTRENVKFQLHMMFGDKGGVIQEVITDHWKDLEKVLL